MVQANVKTEQLLTPFPPVKIFSTVVIATLTNELPLREAISTKTHAQARLTGNRRNRTESRRPCEFDCGGGNGDGFKKNRRRGKAG